MLMIHDYVINVDVQVVSYIFIYLNVGIFPLLFNSVFISNCLLGVLFSFMLIIHDNVVNTDVQMVSYVLIILSVGIFCKLCN